MGLIEREGSRINLLEERRGDEELDHAGRGESQVPLVADGCAVRQIDDGDADLHARGRCCLGE